MITQKQIDEIDSQIRLKIKSLKMNTAEIDTLVRQLDLHPDMHTAPYASVIQDLTLSIARLLYDGFKNDKQRAAASYYFCQSVGIKSTHPTFSDIIRHYIAQLS